MFSCVVLGDTNMALLWAQTAHRQHLQLGDEEKARTEDLTVITRLEAILKTVQPVKYSQFRFPYLS